MEAIKQRRKGLFATAVILLGGSPTLQHVYQVVMTKLAVVGIGPKQLAAIAAGAPLKLLIPSVAVALVPYLLNIDRREEKIEREKIAKRLAQFEQAYRRDLASRGEKT